MEIAQRDKNLCQGKSRRTGNQCQKEIAKGTRFCKFHFGNTAQEQKLVLVRQEQMRLSKSMTQMEIPDETPSQALLRMVQTASRAEQALSSYLAGLDADPMHDAEEENYQNSQRAYAYMEIWQNWCDRLVKYSDVAVRAGVSEKLVELAKQEGRQVVELVLSVLTDPGLELSPVQQTAARKVLADRIRKNIA